MFIVITYIVSYIKAQMSEMFIMHHMHVLYPPMHHMHGGTYLKGERGYQRNGNRTTILYDISIKSNRPILYKRYHKIEENNKRKQLAWRSGCSTHNKRAEVRVLPSSKARKGRAKGEICMRYQSNYVLHKRYHKIEKERKKFKRKVEL